MSTVTGARELAQKFEATNEEIAQIVAGCTDEQWQLTSVREGWTIAAVAHHVAIVQRGFVGMVQNLADGETYTPQVSMDSIDEENARHAREYARADRQETLDILQSSRADMKELIEGFSDDDLERTAGTFGGNELTVGQVVEYVVIGHPMDHLGSMRETLEKDD